MSKDKCCKKTSIGGQALIEGIMMRGPHKTVMAVRNSDGEIVTENMVTKQLKDKYKILGWPIIRGAVSMVESMLFGYKALMKSAELSDMLDEEETEKEPKKEKKNKKNAAETVTETAELINTEESAENEATAEAETAAETVPAETEATAENETAAETVSATTEATAENETAAETVPAETEATAAAKKPADKKDEKKESGLMAVIGVISMVLGVGLAIALFIYLPNLLFGYVNSLTGDKITAFQAAFEGILKIIIFIVYVAIVSQMKDIKRVFMYHGAEHKTIFCYEHGKELTVENIRTERRFHPRCGTSFLILMLIVSIIFYSIIAKIFPLIAANHLIWMALKIVCLPIIVGLGYELIKLCGRHDNILTRIIAAPGVWVQRLTTKEPDDSMIEVAIVAMSAVIPENGEDDRW